MKLILSISMSREPTLLESALEENSKYFTADALDVVFSLPKSSTTTVVLLTPESYLTLVDPGDDFVTQPLVTGFIDRKIRYTKLPYLGVETDATDGSVYVSLNGADHQGRRMMRALMGLGVGLVPVVVTSQEYDDGPAYHWGNTTKRPETIWGYNDSQLPFPDTFPY